MRVDLRLCGNLGLWKRFDILNNNVIIEVDDIVNSRLHSLVDMRLKWRGTQ